MTASIVLDRPTGLRVRARNAHAVVRTGRGGAVVRDGAVLGFTPGRLLRPFEAMPATKAGPGEDPTVVDTLWMTAARVIRIEMASEGVDNDLGIATMSDSPHISRFCGPLGPSSSSEPLQTPQYRSLPEVGA